MCGAASGIWEDDESIVLWNGVLKGVAKLFDERRCVGVMPSSSLENNGMRFWGSVGSATEQMFVSLIREVDKDAVLT